MTKVLDVMCGALALSAPLLFASSSVAQTWPAKSDYVCTVKADTGENEDQRIRIDLDAKAWCSSIDGCKEIKTLFGVKNARVILESSQLEVTSYETAIDRTTGAYTSVVTVGGVENSSRGLCKPAPFTPFGVKLDGSRITGG